MPRLRYKKSWDFSLYEDGENNDEHESEAISGSSWLSNANMAAQLSEAKIKQTISALKAQISCLEAELLSRRLGNSHSSNKNWAKIGNVRPKKDGTGTLGKSTNRRNSTVFQFQKVAALRRTLAKLGVKDVDALLATWSKLNEKEK